MRRLVTLVALTLLWFPASARALTLQDIIGLSKAGLHEDVLLALIDVERPVFPIDAGTIKSLKDAGVADRVLIAIIRSGRIPPPMPPPIEEQTAAVTVAAPVVAQAPAPQVVYVEREAPIREVAVPVAYPVYVAVGSGSFRARPHSLDFDNSVSFPTVGLPSVPAARTTTPPRQAPVYWGWEGQQRPDSWQTPGRDAAPTRRRDR